MSDDTYTFIAKYINKSTQKKARIPSVDPNKTYTDDEIAGLIKQLPDGSRFPLPESWYNKYGFEKPEPMTLQEVCHTSFQTMFAPSDGPVEERGPMEGGVRVIANITVDETDKEPDNGKEVASDIQ